MVKMAPAIRVRGGHGHGDCGVDASSVSSDDQRKTNTSAKLYGIPSSLIFKRNLAKIAATVPRKEYTFVPNEKYMNETMFFNREDTLHTLHRWIELSAGMPTLGVIKSNSRRSSN
jgi:hypothetical protein